MYGMGAIADEDRLDAEERKKVLRRAGRMALPFKRTIIGALAFTALSTFGVVMGPVLLGYGIDNGITPKDAGVLRNTVIFYMVLTVVSYFAARQQFILINRAGEGFLQSLRIRVFDHLQKQSLAFFDRNKSGVLVARMTADIESMSELVQWGLLQFVAAILLVVFSLVLVFVVSWQLALVGLLVMPVIIVASRKFQRDSNAAYLDVRENIGQNLSTLQEGIAGVRVIQAYAREPEQRRRFKQSNRDLYDSHVHSVRVSTWYFGLVETAGVMATALIVGVGGWLYTNDVVLVGQIVSVVLLYAQLFEPVQQLSQLYNTVQSSAASLNKLFGILDTEPDIQDGDKELPRSGELIVRDVGFRYPATETAVLTDVSITVADGERLALVGPTGAGKSTLAKLMARLYDPTEGSISFGGIDLRDADAWRRCVTVWSWCPRRGSCSEGPSPTTFASPDPTRPTTTSAPPSTQSVRWSGSTSSTRASTPRSASGGRDCRQVNDSWCRSLGRRSSTRPCSCSTKRRATSTRAPSSSSNGHSTR